MALFAKIATISPLLLILNACTHRASIEFVDQYHISQIPDYSYLPPYYNFELANIWNGNYVEGFQCLVFSSASDLGDVANRGGMLVIYYHLYVCGESDLFFSGPIFPVEGEDDRVFYYAAYWPENLQADQMDFMTNSMEDLLLALQKHGACLSITAGAMGGAQLRSNRIKVDFP